MCLFFYVSVETKTDWTPVFDGHTHTHIDAQTFFTFQSSVADIKVSEFDAEPRVPCDALVL